MLRCCRNSSTTRSVGVSPPSSMTMTSNLVLGLINHPGRQSKSKPPISRTREHPAFLADPERSRREGDGQPTQPDFDKRQRAHRAATLEPPCGRSESICDHPSGFETVYRVSIVLPSGNTIQQPLPTSTSCHWHFPPLQPGSEYIFDVPFHRNEFSIRIVSGRYPFSVKRMQGCLLDPMGCRLCFRKSIHDASKDFGVIRGEQRVQELLVRKGFSKGVAGRNNPCKLDEVDRKLAASSAATWKDHEMLSTIELGETLV